MKLALLLEHGDALVVNKPAGVLVHNSRFAGAREATLVDAVRDAHGGDLHPVHRLDRQTSGCVLFARGPDAARAWQEALSADSARKRYVALVRGHLLEPHDVDHPLRDADRRAQDAPRRPARTLVAPLLRSAVARCSLVEAQPRTGRMHQVRRHVKHISHPILGDATYGKGPLNREYRARFGLARMALHCASLHLDGPDGTSLDAAAPWPNDLTSVLAQLFDVEALAALTRLDAPTARTAARTARA